MRAFNVVMLLLLLVLAVSGLLASNTSLAQTTSSVTLTVSGQIVGGGDSRTFLPVFFYFFNGTNHSWGLTTTPTSLSMPAGTGWQVAPDPTSGSGADERWTSLAADGYYHGTATASETLAFAFYHQLHLTTLASPSDGGTVAPTSGWYGAGNAVPLGVAPANGYVFSSWTGTGAGSYTGNSPSPQIAINGPITETASFTPVSTPTTSEVTVTSAPGTGDGFVEVDGTLIATPQTFSWAAGTTHAVTANSPVMLGATTYYFQSWSDGGAQSHTITVRATATITAYYTTYQYAQVVVTSNPTGSGFVSLEGQAVTTPFTMNGVPIGSSFTVTANSPITVAGTTYVWMSWSDGGAQTHRITVTASATFTAFFTAQSVSTPTTPAPGIVSGTVYGYNCQNALEPLAGVIISASGPTTATATTNTDGSFTLSLTPGAYTIVVTASGYVPFESNVTVSSGSTSTSAFYLNEEEASCYTQSTTQTNQTTQTTTTTTPEYPGESVVALLVIAFSLVAAIAQRNRTVEQSTVCRFCFHPKGQAAHKAAGREDCVCACNH